MTGHGSHDDASYVPDEFFEEGKRKDPIPRFVALLKNHDVVSDGDVSAMDEQIAAEVRGAEEKGEAGPLPEGPDTLLGVYAE